MDFPLKIPPRIILISEGDFEPEYLLEYYIDWLSECAEWLGRDFREVEEQIH